MKVFVVNSGSSSIKFQLFSMTNEIVLAKGIVERVGSDEACLEITAHPDQPDEKDVKRSIDAPNHSAGMRYVIDALVDEECGVLNSVDEIQAIGHRVVHGGEDMKAPALIDDEVIRIIQRNADLAPLHNPPNLSGISAAMEAIPDKPNVAVFDTAFLSSMPPEAFRYAVPDEWYREHGIRKYGFHGTSHKYVTRRAAEHLGKDVSVVNLITAHLGNGCSITAVQSGKPVDHSMGMTPLEGLMMGTRSGDLDPAVVFHMIEKGMSPQSVDNVLNKKSGLLGVSGYSNDMRDLLSRADEGHKGAELAVRMFVYRIVKYIGAYYAILPSVDAVVLTGGIGENSIPVREGICRRLLSLGTSLDEYRNRKTIRGEAGPISTDDSALPVWIVPTNEELMIARDTRQLVEETVRA